MSETQVLFVVVDMVNVRGCEPANVGARLLQGKVSQCKGVNGQAVNGTEMGV